MYQTAPAFFLLIQPKAPPMNVVSTKKIVEHVSVTIMAYMA